jgi:uncharacterized protein YegJ (DUF2314 family)
MSNEQRKGRGVYLNFALFSLLFAICYISCGRPARDVSRRSSPAVEVEQSDEEIERIAENARRALPIFFRNLARPEKGANNFYVKYPISSDDGSVEQVWLANIRFKNNRYYGTLANTIKSIDRRKKGDTIIINTDKITDWMYIQDGKIIGGRSIKYLLEKTPEERRNEDQRKILRMFE